ncbi:MAG: tetratricopeptide repeat protein [Bacteroidetes bacterium]|nr:tetratricopeptide repeat protein [Bacteroidota bacterium]MBS1631951.1 tetratricopeptide repeat protein [Bacteroidota bacterium]
MKKKLVLILFLFVSNLGIAQTPEAIGNLHHQIAIAKDDTSRINQQAFLCLLYRLGNADSSLFYGELALKAARKINYVKGEVLALSFMSITLVQMGNLPKALETGFKAIEMAKANGLKNYEGALNAIGEAYIVLKDYPKALSYLREQNSLSEANNNIEPLGYGEKDMAIVFEQMNQLDSAIFYDQKALKTLQKINREEPQLYEILGNVKMKSGNRAEALNLYQKCLDVSLKNNERRTSSSAYIKLALLYKDINQPDSAIYYAQKGLEESELISQKQTIQQAALLLSGLYEARDIKESLRYLKIADTYKDSLFGANNLQSIQTLVAQTEERQKEIADAKINYQNKLKQYGFIGALAILLIIALILYRNNRQKQKTNKVLAKTLSDLKSTQSQLIQSEKMASLGELTAGIAHEIQNPLNFVNNFSEVSTELVDEMNEEISKGNLDDAKEIANDLKQNLEKINHHGKRAGDIVKGMLQHSSTSAGQKELTDINVLADEYLRLAYHGLRAKDKSFNAKFETEFDETLSKINVVPLDIGRVVLNLINNAFYAVNEKNKSGIEGYNPTVTVSTKKINDKVEIKVSDNGNGIPEKIKDKIFQPFFTTKPTGSGTGLGLSLSYDIVKAHGGEIKVESKEGEGSKLIIQIPGEK